MPLTLHPAHPLAQISYAPRVLAFGYAFLVLGLLAGERGAGGWAIAIGVFQFIVYPHIAYLHTRLASDSKRAELNNLYADSLMLGAWAAQMQFALWPAGGMLVAVCLNNAANGGFRHLGGGLLLFIAGALTWGAWLGFPYQPATGQIVSGFSLLGLVAYASWIGIILWEQNRRILRTRNALKSSEEQFRFITEHAGDLVAMLDEAGRFCYASPSHLQYIGADAVAPGREWVELVHPEDRLYALQFLGLVRTSRSTERVHLRMFGAGQIWQVLECQGNPVRDESGNTDMVVLIMRDISARLRAEIDMQLAAD